MAPLVCTLSEFASRIKRHHDVARDALGRAVTTSRSVCRLVRLVVASLAGWSVGMGAGAPLPPVLDAFVSGKD